MKYKKKNVLIIEWISLPESIKDSMIDNIHNDSYIDFFSELEPKELTIEGLKQYQKNMNISGSLNDFIHDQSLQIEKYIIDKNIDMSDVDQIIFHIEW